jgi:5-methylcytosine-specific restriction endonuclease McrA
MVGGEMKRCAKCGQEKPLTAFHKHRREPDGHQTRCKVCACATTRDWRARNRSVIRERIRARHATNPEPRRRSSRLDRERHGAKYQERGAAWYHANRERVLQKALTWQKVNRELANDRNQRRRARVKGAPVVEKVDREAIIARDCSICQICGLIVAPEDIHLDHIVPLSQGGTHTAANLRVTHSRCNLSRKRKNCTEQLPLLV